MGSVPSQSGSLCDAGLAVEIVRDQVAAAGQARPRVPDGADHHVVQMAGQERVDLVRLDGVDALVSPGGGGGEIGDREGHDMQAGPGGDGGAHPIGEAAGADVAAVLHQLRHAALGVRGRVLDHQAGPAGDSVHVDVAADIPRKGRDGREGAQGRGMARDDAGHHVAVGAGAVEEPVAGLPQRSARECGSPPDGTRRSSGGGRSGSGGKSGSGPGQRCCGRRRRSRWRRRCPAPPRSAAAPRSRGRVRRRPRPGPSKESRRRCAPLPRPARWSGPRRWPG